MIIVGISPLPLGYLDAVRWKHTLMAAALMSLAAFGRVEVLPPGALGFEHLVVHFIPLHLLKYVATLGDVAVGLQVH